MSEKFESYQPSSEEINPENSAESLEEKFNRIDDLPWGDNLDKEIRFLSDKEFDLWRERQRNRYRDEIVLDGIEVEVRWETGPGYVLYFPQIEVGKVEGVNDTTIVIGKDAKDAKSIFRRAVGKIASTDNPDVYKIYNEIKELS